MPNSLVYLFGSLAMLALFLVAMLNRRSQVVPATLGGLLSAPYAFASVLFVPEYWHPERIVGSVVGIEDFIFSFAAGGLAWLAAVAPHHERINLRIHGRTMLVRYLGVSFALFAVASFLMFILGWHVAPSFLVTAGIVCVALVIARPWLWRLCWAGMVGYGLLYTVFVALLFMIFPDFREQWNWPQLLGWSLFGVPAEEIGYAIAFGAFWPLTVGFVLGVRDHTRDPATC